MDSKPCVYGNSVIFRAEENKSDIFTMAEVCPEIVLDIEVEICDNSNERKK